MPDRDRLSPDTKALLEQRYGRNSRKTGTYTGVILAVIFLPWLLWSAWHHSNPELRTYTVRYSTVDDRSISLTFELTRSDPQANANCTLIALDIDRNVVGEMDLAIPPANSAKQLITAEITTRLRAVAAAVDRCRITSDAPRVDDK